MKPTPLFHSWAEYLSCSLDFPQKLALLKQSKLTLQHPNRLREEWDIPRAWLSLIPPDFLTEAEAFYQSHKSEKQIAIPEIFADLILQEAPSTYEGVLSALDEEGRTKRIAFLLTLFVVKRPDLGYSSGMNSILGVVLSVFPREIRAFCLFCHLIENIYPMVAAI